MHEQILIGLASVIVLGVAAQWLAWRLRFPAILLLLGTGLLAGPVTGLLDPDKLFGNLLLPIIPAAVALILYEGGLSLKIKELPSVGRVVLSLVTVGALVTWVLSAIAAHYLFGLDWSLSVLLGAILIVTGPTVIQPLLREIRPRGAVGPILKWEGIVIDPIGALLAVLVFEVVHIGGITTAPSAHGDDPSQDGDRRRRDGLRRRAGAGVSGQKILGAGFSTEPGLPGDGDRRVRRVQHHSA